MSVDMGAITESLFESELFGHKKGAFTDAREDKMGRLQAANEGSLFLDEIGNLPLHLQAKLLSVLEQRQFSPVGSSDTIDLDVRVIAATNLSKQQLSDEGLFRQDLLFRLNTVEITLPPLRDRREDIPMIAEYYAEYYCRKYGQQNKTFSPAALDVITHYAWPGNVRALRHGIERAVILSQTPFFEPVDFSIDQALTASATTPNSKRLAALNDPGMEPASDLNLDRLEKKTIEHALKQNRYNISHAAKALGLTRAALYRRMEKHGL